MQLAKIRLKIDAKCMWGHVIHMSTHAVRVLLLLQVAGIHSAAPRRIYTEFTGIPYSQLKRSVFLCAELLNEIPNLKKCRGIL